MNPIRVILADDHTILRAGIRSLLQGMAGIEVVAEANDGQQALDLVRQHQPHIVSTDISMPVMTGLEMTQKVTQEFPQVRVLILSMYDNEEYVTEALKVGALGYLLKDSSPSELELAIRTVAKGKKYLSPLVNQRVIDSYVKRLSGLPAPPSLLKALTNRQRETLTWIAKGCSSSKDIAKKMNISKKTVESFRSQLMAKLNIHDVAGLVRLAIREGLVSPEE